jgi:putative ABC transport system permease protein
MHLLDSLHFARHALSAARGRTWLMWLAMGIGVGSVVVLTALGEGARRYVQQQFSGLGSNLVIVLPGRVETTGGPPPLIGGTPQDLTLGDAEALLRSPHIRRVAPLVVGSAPVSRGSLEKEVTIAGSTAALQPVRQHGTGPGPFPAGGGWSGSAPWWCWGPASRRELFGNGTPHGRVGAHPRPPLPGDRGVAIQGESLGFMDLTTWPSCRWPRPRPCSTPNRCSGC